MTENPAPETLPEASEPRQETRKATRQESSWIWGVLLVVFAVLLFLKNLGLFSMNNWWALFILLPALGSFASAWRISRAAGGRFNHQARSSIVWGFFLLLVTGMFLFNLNWIYLGPILICLAGLAMIVNAIMPG